MKPNSSLSETNESPMSTITLGSVKIVKFTKFLPVQVSDTLYQTACANQHLFHPPGGPGSPVGSTNYWSEETQERDTEGGSTLIDAMGVLSEHIVSHLPSIFRALEIDPFPVSSIPLNLIHGLDGHSGSPHADSIDGRFVVSLLYYFSKVPQVFRGGDLDLYETDGESPDGHSHEPVTTIEYEDNLLLAFKSHTIHGVTDVHCDSSEFADGRFVAVAFLGAP